MEFYPGWGTVFVVLELFPVTDAEEGGCAHVVFLLRGLHTALQH